MRWEACNRIEHMHDARTVCDSDKREREKGILAVLFFGGGPNNQGVREVTAGLKGVHTMEKVKNHCFKVLQII